MSSQWFIIWHWLVIHNLWQSVIGWFVLTCLTVSATWLPWRRHRKTQKNIADRLDTSTPGGLTDVIEAIQNSSSSGGMNDEAHR